MRIVTLLALLVCAQAYAADESYPEHAGDKYPVEHWRLQLIERPCDEHCREAMNHTGHGFEHYSRLSCIRRGIEVMEDAYDVPQWLQEAVVLVGFNCAFIRVED